MYIRMTGGRDRGEVKDFNFEDAPALIKNGDAVAVNFNRDEQSQIAPQVRVAIPQRSADAPAVTTKSEIPAVNAQKARRKP
jgi:hypothetical protein